MLKRCCVVPAVLCAWVGGSAWAQWTDDASLTTPVVTGVLDQDVIKLGVAPDGSSWIGWNDFQPGGIEIRVQRLGSDGVATFAPGGLLVSDHPQNTFVVDWDLRADSVCNCMLAFVVLCAGGDFAVPAYLLAPHST